MSKRNNTIIVKKLTLIFQLTHFLRQCRFAILKKQFPTISGKNTIHQIENDSAETHKNVVLITIESYSADFMKTYGNTQNITPFLDSLSQKKFAIYQFVCCWKSNR